MSSPVPRRLAPRTCATVALAVAGLVIAACGGGGTSASTTTSSPTASTATVSVKQISGVGSTLVDAHGMTLYTPDQESSGTITCTGACTAVWVPLVPASGTPTGSGAGKLAVLTRPDGSKQVTANGHPLYTFARDSSAGQATGDGASDAFGGHSFTWHAVLAGGTLSSGSGSSGGSSSGGGGSSRGGY
jgi:predicted lipoprotein with Yx(FWY)xxD motif